MCDYSLHNVHNRLAVAGEPLRVHQFPSGSLGLASPADLRPHDTLPTTKRWVQAIKDWFSTSHTVPAVCVPPGARLVVRDIPSSLQKGLGVGQEEEVTFVQLSPETTGYHDAVRFQNGQQILLQRLPVGLQLDVLYLTEAETELPRLTAEDLRLVMASRPAS